MALLNSSVILFIMTIVIAYLFTSALVFWILTNNIFIWRSKNYTIPFEGTKQGWLPEGIRYWRCDNPLQSNDRWVIMFHSWGRNSARMVDRAMIYWERGYSLLFVDAWSHGQSKYRYTTTALWYSQHARKIVEVENISSPVVHGLSFGAIAATIYASNYPTQALIAEALMNNVRDMMYGFLSYLKIPVTLFGWEVSLLLKSKFPWHLVNPSRNLPLVKVPIFLLHGEKDSMFPLNLHYEKNVELLKTNDISWVVENSPHSKMYQHPEYRNKLESFLNMVEN